MSSRDDVPEEVVEPDELDATAPAETVTPDDPAEVDARAESPDEGVEPETEAPPDIVAWSPPEGGQPFAYKADGREFPVEGGLRYDHGIYLPTTAWEQVQRNLGDWEARQHRYSQLQRQYEERDPEKHPDVVRARVTTQNFLALLQQGPEKVAEWLDNFQTNAPLLQAQIEAQTYKAQLESRQSQWTEQQSESRAREIAAELPGYLKQNIDYLLTNTPELKDLAGQSDALLQKLWEYRDYLFVEAVEGDLPEHGLKQGQIGVHRARLTKLLQDRAESAAEFKRIQDATKLNAKATGKAPVAPTVTARGRPAPGSRSTSYKPGDSSWKDAFLSGAIED
jgi:hypothetical protein